MKKFLIVLATVAAAALMLFCGCTPSNGKDGRDGKDGKDVSIAEVYDKYVAEYGDISFDDFLKKYLSFSNDDLNAATSLQTTINKSLLSGVSILTRFAYNSGSSSGGLFPGFPSTSRSTYKVFTGSGVIIHLDKENGDALIATNCHVIYDDTSVNRFCQDVRLYLYGQDESGVNYNIDSNYNITGDENYRIQATVIGASVDYDIALLKVENSSVLKRSDAIAASFSKERDVYVGETVYAVGNASGEGLSASNGIISKDSEQIELGLSDLNEDEVSLYRVMRTTAAINHGNSGGALYNIKGEIVGLVNAKDDAADVDNMGYVLPANNVRRILRLMYDTYTANGNKMPSSGGFKKALLNIQTEITDAYSQFNEATGRAEIKETIKVYKVVGNPAAGKLQVGDELKAVKLVASDGTVKDEQIITRSYHLTEMLFSARSGDTVIITVIRSGQAEPMDVSITILSTDISSVIK